MVRHCMTYKHGLLALSVALALTGCATNKGSFELDNVQAPPKTNPNPVADKPVLVDDNSTPRREQTADKIEPALGYALEIPRRVYAPKSPKPEELAVNINESNIKPITHKLTDLPKVFADTLKQKDGYIDDLGISYSHDVNTKDAARELQFVRSGYVIGEKSIKFIKEADGTRKIDPAGQYGYVFYQGTNPAKDLPTAKATYNGTWDFVSDAKSTRQGLPDGFSDDLMSYGAKGNAVGATSLDADVNRKDDKHPMGLTSHFEVDFADKKLTGKLTQNHNTTNTNAKQVITDRYDIEATIKGNRFLGKATAKDSNHEIFGKNASSLEGGFFGDKAQELAGKFVADEGSLFAVFAGKQDKPAEQVVATAFDATQISIKDLKLSPMDTFGNVAYLVIDGRVLPLLPEGKTKFADMDFNHFFETTKDGKVYKLNVCCNNLDYIKFGEYNIDNQGYLYLIGERTPIANIPNSGSVQYRGTWNARILSQDNKAWATTASKNQPSDARSLFDFDFTNKKFTGKLIDHNGTDDYPVFNLAGSIVANGFTGTAKTREGGFNIDTGSTQGGTLVNIDAKVQGGFYGDNAQEIGGTLFGDGNDKVGGVFGGKRQTTK